MSLLGHGAGPGCVPGHGPASVVVVGSINADQVVRVERRPGPGETVGNARVELHPGGKGANQAVAAARSGAKVAMVGRVGDDPYGLAQRAALVDEGIDVTCVQVTEGVATGLAIVMVTPDGENSITVVPGANHSLAPSDVDIASPLIGRAGVVVAQLEVPVETVERAVELAEGRSTVVLNCAPFSDLPSSVLLSTTVLVANELEAAALAECTVTDQDTAFDAATRIVSFGPRCAVVTLGPFGAVVVSSDVRVHVPAGRVPVVDTTGAGDAFVGAFAAALSAGRGVVDAVRFGVDVGSATTTRHGARAALPEELEGHVPRSGRRS